MIMIEVIAKFLHCGDKTDRKNRMIGNYGISKDNSHNINYLYPVYHFRYRWVQKLIFKYLACKIFSLGSSAKYMSHSSIRKCGVGTIKYVIPEIFFKFNLKSLNTFF